MAGTSAAHYLFALVIVAGALALKLVVDSSLPWVDTGYHILFAAVALAAWVGGFVPGALATAAGALGTSFLLVQPLGVLGVPDPNDRVQLGLFLVEGLVIAGLTAGLRSARSHAIKARIEAEDQLAGRERVDRELRQSRDYLAAILRGVADGITVQEPDGHIAYANDAAARIIGFPSAEELVHTPVSEVMARFEILDEDGEPFPLERLPGRLALQGKQGPEALLRFRDLRSGEERWSLVQATPVSEEGGRVLFAVNIFREVTAEQQARAAREAFMGVLSHELRTPITTIYGGAQVLVQRTNLSEETRRQITEDISAEATRLQRLIEDLLVLTHDERGALDLAREPVLLHHLVAEVMRDEEGRWPGVEFVAPDPGPLPLVQGEPVYVEQVLRNLVENAAKYSPLGGHVTVVTEAREHDVAVRVLDEGPGFAPDEAPRLFDLFYRAPQTAKQAPGAGIGLFVCRRLIESMGGRIWAQPRPDAGAEFGFSLAVLPPSEEAG